MAEVAAFAPVAFATTEDAVLAPLVEPPELFCLRVAVRRVFSSLAHGLAEPGIAPLQEADKKCFYIWRANHQLHEQHSVEHSGREREAMYSAS